MSDSHVVLKNSEETVYSGYLFKGEERKEGTQVAFKDKKKYFVLKCIGSKLLTMTAYKDEKDFRTFGRKGKTVDPDSDRFHAFNSKVKVHKVQMAIKKHRTADILCIVQNKRPLYLEANNRADLDAWYNAFNSILIQLGWKESIPEEHRPMSYPPIKETSSTDQVNGDRYSSPSVIENAFQDEPERPRPKGIIDGGYICLPRTSPEISPPSTPPRSPHIKPRSDNNRRSVPLGHSCETAHNKENCQHCCQRHHIVGHETPLYGNIHPVEDLKQWEKDVAVRRERLVDVRQFYSEYLGPPPPAEVVRHHRYSAERRRSRSTSDVHQDLQNLRKSHHLWEAPDSNSSDDEIPPQLPERTFSNRIKPTPKRRVGIASPPPNLNAPIFPPPPQDPNEIYQHPISPPVQSPIVKQFLDHHHPHHHHPPPPPPQYHNKDHRKISAPDPPNSVPLYVNTADTAGSPPSPLARRPKNTSMIDVSRRPLPSPDRPSSFEAMLQWEQGLHDGLPIAVPKKDLVETLALVKIADYVWIAGKKRGCPDTISSRFHVGDQLRQINDQIVVDVSIAHALFKTTAKEEVILMVRRIPHAKIFTVRRTSADIGWGLKMEYNKVLDVPKTGPAADAGIKARPEGALSKRLCSWIVTQINKKPVPLSCSRDEVNLRLDNTDMEMTIVLQPEDFINKLKSELQNVKFSIDYS